MVEMAGRADRPGDRPQGKSPRDEGVTRFSPLSWQSEIAEGAPIEAIDADTVPNDSLGDEPEDTSDENGGDAGEVDTDEGTE